MLDLASDAAAHRRTAAAATAALEAASSASHSRGVPSKQGRTRHGFFCTFALGCSASTPLPDRATRCASAENLMRTMRRSGGLFLFVA